MYTTLNSVVHELLTIITIARSMWCWTGIMCQKMADNTNWVDPNVEAIVSLALWLTHFICTCNSPFDTMNPAVLLLSKSFSVCRYECARTLSESLKCFFWVCMDYCHLNCDASINAALYSYHDRKINFYSLQTTRTVNLSFLKIKLSILFIHFHYQHCIKNN